VPRFPHPSFVHMMITAQRAFCQFGVYVYNGWKSAHSSSMEYDGGVSVLEVTEIPCAPSRGADADLIATHLGPKYVVPRES